MVKERIRLNNSKKTGGGVSCSWQPNEAEQKVLQVMGKVVVSGLPGDEIGIGESID